MAQTIQLQTSDHVLVSAFLTPSASGPTKRLLLIAPGFAQNHATRSMQALVKGLARETDVLFLDFRGTGASSGHFSFGSKEYLDLLSAGDWARERYSDISLLGFSLGAYSALRAALENPDRFSRLLLVSGFSWPGEVLLSGRWLFYPLYAAFRQVQFTLKPEDAPLFRWGRLFDPKPDLRRTPLYLNIPCHFLAGDKDFLVPLHLSFSLYQKVHAHRSWTLFPQGVHAEEMFLQDPEGFILWLDSRLNA